MNATFNWVYTRVELDFKFTTLNQSTDEAC